MIPNSVHLKREYSCNIRQQSSQKSVKFVVFLALRFATVEVRCFFSVVCALFAVLLIRASEIQVFAFTFNGHRLLEAKKTSRTTCFSIFTLRFCCFMLLTVSLSIEFNHLTRQKSPASPPPEISRLIDSHISRQFGSSA